MDVNGPRINAGTGLVKHWVLTVVVDCTHCGAASTVMLVNAARVECPSCGAVHVLDSFHWEARHPDRTEFGISASEPRITLARM